MTIDQLLWEASRAAALTAFFLVSASILTGQALRSALFGGAVRNRELLSLHRFLTLCWMPLLAVHVLSITLDSVARITPLDLVLPFRVSYASIPVGLGTLGFELLIAITVASYLRDRMDPIRWRFLHRLSYPAFAMFALHALLAGTDFSRTAVLAPAAAVLVFVVVVSLARVIFGRLLPARS